MSDLKLPPEAYEPKPGQEYVPLTAGQTLPEFTLKAVLTGALLGVVFGAANTYLGLKAGLTISTSIPVAVLTVVVFRALAAAGGKHSILELNLSQTTGSASSSVASGVLFTIPALFMWGVDVQLLQISLLACAGGLLGVLAMVPLRRYLIKREHGQLPYPEGMACAEVLVAAEGGGNQARHVFRGIGLGLLLKLLTDGFKLLPGKLSIALPAKAGIAVSVSPALIGVGYILGPKIASVMVAGGALSSLIIIPIINWWGSGLEMPWYPETEALIRDMSAKDIWNRYVRYIGAGAVATGGFITLIKSIPTMIESFKLGIAQMGKTGDAQAERTDRDLSLGTVGLFALGILAVLALVPGILGAIDSVVVRCLASLIIAVFAFFFVTVSSRIVGLVGVTSNPTSGMTIATLLGASLIFLGAGWTDVHGKVTALMVGTAVCIAASIAGDTSQDLKTGFLLGATPRFQQISELVGVVTCAAFVCAVVLLLHETTEGGLGGPDLPAPQATLMKLVIDGVIDQNLPWILIGIGAVIAIAVWLMGLPVLAFAVGVYLPLYTMAAVFCGGMLRHYLTRGGGEESTTRREQGILFGSGLVGGAGLTGVLLALWVGLTGEKQIGNFGIGWDGMPILSGFVATAAIAAILWLMQRSAASRS